jgi:hypothetical protein
MDKQNPDLAIFSSCNEIMRSWASFGIEALVIFALILLITYILWAAKSEREDILYTMDNLQNAMADLSAKLQKVLGDDDHK